MKSKTLAFLFVSLLACGISASGQTSVTCPVSITLLKLTENVFTVKVSGQPGKSNSPDKAILFLTVQTVDDQNRKHWDGAQTIQLGTYTSTGIWNSGSVRRGKLILSIDKFKRGSSEPLVPVDGCHTLERAFDFGAPVSDPTKPTGK